jgi:Flp pilus assembly protein TadG
MTPRVTRYRLPLAALRAIPTDRRGMAAVEFGLLAPLLMALAALALDFGYAFNIKLKVVSATSAAAQYAFQNGQSISASTLATFQHNVTSVAQSTAGMASPPSVTVLFNNAADSSAVGSYLCPTGYAPVAWTSTGSGGATCPGGVVQSGKYVTITVTSTMRSLFQPDPVLGTLITASDTAIVRVQ